MKTKSCEVEGSGGSPGSALCAKIAETLSRKIYGKSSSVDAPENQNSDFRSGYAVGVTVTPETRDNEWLDGWREYGSPLFATPDWLDWKRGFHAGRFAAIGAAAPAHPQHNTVITHDERSGERRYADTLNQIQPMTTETETPRSLAVIAGSPLLEIAERLRTQDNRITQNPMFCVQQRVKIRGLHPRWSDNTEWILDGEVVEPETEGAEEYGCRHDWQTVMVAFTEEGCKEYLRQNGHNLREPRIYVESFNRCPEMIVIRDWLLSLENEKLSDRHAENL